jgi:hypothetical protein
VRLGATWGARRTDVLLCRATHNVDGGTGLHLRPGAWVLFDDGRIGVAARDNLDVPELETNVPQKFTSLLDGNADEVGC